MSRKEDARYVPRGDGTPNVELTTLHALRQQVSLIQATVEQAEKRLHEWVAEESDYTEFMLDSGVGLLRNRVLDFAVAVKAFSEDVALVGTRRQRAAARLRLRRREAAPSPIAPPGAGRAEPTS